MRIHGATGGYVEPRLPPPRSQAAEGELVPSTFGFFRFTVDRGLSHMLDIGLKQIESPRT